MYPRIPNLKKIFFQRAMRSGQSPDRIRKRIDGLSNHPGIFHYPSIALHFCNDFGFGGSYYSFDHTPTTRPCQLGDGGELYHSIHRRLFNSFDRNSLPPSTTNIFRQAMVPSDIITKESLALLLLKVVHNTDKKHEFVWCDRLLATVKSGLPSAEASSPTVARFRIV